MHDSPPLLYVTDTSVFVDVFSLSLHEGFFQLGRIITSDFIFEECRKNQGCHQMLLSQQVLGLLEVKPLDSDQISSLEIALSERGGLSPEDCSVYVLAKAEAGILLTGDKTLRNFALDSLVETHGLLYCISQLVDRGWFNKSEACIHLEAWMTFNARAPKKLIRAQLKKWR